MKSVSLKGHRRPSSVSTATFQSGINEATHSHSAGERPVTMTSGSSGGVDPQNYVSNQPY